MEVLVYPDPRLLAKTRLVESVTPAMRDDIEEMFRLMYSDRGVGLAAPQVGWSVRLFVMNPSGDASKPELQQVVMNPRILKRSGRVSGEEGCLSFPGIYVEVERAQAILAAWSDLEGRGHEERLVDWEARVFQHEFDHLENVLLVDRMSPAERVQHAQKLDELRRTLKTPT